MAIEYKAYAIGSDGSITLRIDLVCEDDNSAKERARQLVDAPIPSNYGRAKGSWAGLILRIKARPVAASSSSPKSLHTSELVALKPMCSILFQRLIVRGATDSAPNVPRKTKLRPRQSLTRAALRASCRPTDAQSPRAFLMARLRLVDIQARRP